MIRNVFFIVLSILLLSSLSFAQSDPTELSFKRVRPNKNATFTAAKGCTLLTDSDSNTVAKIVIVKNGARVKLPASYKLKNKKLPSKYKYFACGAVNNVVGLYARKSINATPVEISLDFDSFVPKPTGNNKKLCSKTFGSSDGQGGWVWKPSSDSDGKLVALLPSNQRSSSMKLYTKAGKKIETLRYVGPTNGNRPTFRGNRHGSGYPKNLTVQYKLGSKNVCRKIKNPGSRYD